jgi:hypothetical protein
MKKKNSHSTVLLLLASQPQPQIASLKRWFREHRFLTCETTDIYQALEDISDFTTASRPDVVLLEISSFVKDFPVIRKLVQPLSGSGDVKIVAINDSGTILDENDCFVGSLKQIKTELGKIIPGHLTARAVN